MADIKLLKYFFISYSDLFNLLLAQKVSDTIAYYIRGKDNGFCYARDFNHLVSAYIDETPSVC